MLEDELEECAQLLDDCQKDDVDRLLYGCDPDIQWEHRRKGPPTDALSYDYNESSGSLLVERWYLA